MKIFHCDNCLHTVFFENTECERCYSALGYDPSRSVMVALSSMNTELHSINHPERQFRYCANHVHDVCNWLIDANDQHELCVSCRLNQTIPNLATGEFLAAWRKLEFAKHKLIYSLSRFSLPIRDSENEASNGLAFSFLSEKFLPDNEKVYTGHSSGLITIKVSEADSVNREQIRMNMNEPYRTLIGHFRHEVGHYYWDQLIRDSPVLLEKYRTVFGDEREDYSQSLERHYAEGVRENWRDNYISSYASAHPWEDWAETWAHYLHIVEIMDTAHSFGMSIKANTHGGNIIEMQEPFDPYSENDFDRLSRDCMPLIFAVNSMNRSMGQPDLYPFVVNNAVYAKLRFIHEVLWGVRSPGNMN